MTIVQKYLNHFKINAVTLEMSEYYAVSLNHCFQRFDGFIKYMHTNSCYNQVNSDEKHLHDSLRKNQY